MFQVFVPGIPKPQGSKTAYVRSGRAILVEANKHLPEWRKALVGAFEARTDHNEVLFDDAVMFEIAFWMPKPKTNQRLNPTTKPDLDKLIRAIFDAAAIAKIIKDDSYVIEVSARKMWDTHHPAGATITVHDLSPTRRNLT